MKKVGILHPGAMGISVAATIKNGGHAIYWASEGRSAASAARATEHGLEDGSTVALLCQTCDILVSVCPPHAAEAVAREAVGHGFRGIYIDGNAISPMRAKQIAAIVTTAGATFVDGGIIGGPAWKRGTTWLYLSGDAAETAVSIFEAGPLETEVLGLEIGQASALKMCFAAYTKGTTALLSAILGAADNLGVWPALQEQWRRYEWDLADSAPERVRRVTAKAWRFAGEMEEIAATLEATGVPGGFHEAANLVYQRTAHFKNAPDVPELTAVLNALRQES